VQRDRLELGPEVSDYEVIATAHASYVAADKAEADALARAAEIQRAKALSDSVSDELRRAQKNGLAITKIAGLELTQKDIADVLERCSQVGGSSSAATDYINSKKTALKAFHTDPFTNPSDLNPTSATAPFSATDLLTAASASLPEHSAPDHFTAAAEKIEHDLQAMKAFRGRIGTTPRDFSAEIAEIETELAELKAHRAKAPGDLVRDSVDGLGGGDESIAGELEEEEAEEAAEVAEGVEGGKKEGKKGKSRAEQRRVAREKKKGKGRE
jgi:hypothetical protein